MVLVVVGRGAIGWGWQRTAGVQYVRGPMSALSAASDVKEEEGGGCYENCSMVKQSDGDSAPSHTSLTPSFSFFSLSFTNTYNNSLLHTRSRGIEPRRALRACRLAGEGAAPHARYRHASSDFLKVRPEDMVPVTAIQTLHTHTCSALRQDSMEHVLRQIFAV